MLDYADNSRVEVIIFKRLGIIYRVEEKYKSIRRVCKEKKDKGVE